MHLIEFETSFGLVAASEQALAELLRALLADEDHAAAEDLPEAVSW